MKFKNAILFLLSLVMVVSIMLMVANFACFLYSLGFIDESQLAYEGGKNYTLGSFLFLFSFGITIGSYFLLKKYDVL